MRSKTDVPIVWRKLIQTRLEDVWLERLRWVGEERCVLNALPCKKTERIEVYCHSDAEARKLHEHFGGEIRRVRSAQWMKSQRRRFALAIPPHLCVASDAEAIPVAHRSLPKLIIPAGLAFGTGEHPTTAMCLRHSQRLMPEKPGRVLDAGTGSGILALAAAVRGHAVTAIDYDPESIRIAKENARLNPHVPKVDWRAFDVREFKPRGKFDLIVANLFSDLLCTMIPKFGRWMRPSGTMILSGILQSQEAGVTRAVKENGLGVVRRLRRGKWVCLILEKAR
jgi:ribosomal protein L11 methyltransferase